jgi:hypothetical protein
MSEINFNTVWIYSTVHMEWNLFFYSLLKEVCFFTLKQNNIVIGNLSQKH